MSRAAVLSIVLATSLWLAAPALAAQRWRLPVDGDVAGRFSFDPRAPYERGWRRGVDLAGRPGAAVTSACAGVVTFAGRLPGGRGVGVTVRCGALVATHAGLGAARVSRGALVDRGGRLGTLGPTGVLRLGARRAGERHGYTDPMALATRAVPPPLGPAPRPARRPRPAAPAPPRGAPPTPAMPQPPGVTPPAAWLGLALLAGALGASTARRSRTRARAHAPRGVVHRPGAPASRR